MFKRKRKEKEEYKSNKENKEIIKKILMNT